MAQRNTGANLLAGLVVLGGVGGLAYVLYKKYGLAFRLNVQANRRILVDDPERLGPPQLVGPIPEIVYTPTLPAGDLLGGIPSPVPRTCRTVPPPPGWTGQPAIVCS